MVGGISPPKDTWYFVENASNDASLFHVETLDLQAEILRDPMKLDYSQRPFQFRHQYEEGEQPRSRPVTET